MRKRYLHIPTWAALVYGAAGAILIPWTYQLAHELPERHLSGHWNAAWVGFDSFMIVLLLATAILALSKSIYVVLTGSALGTVLLIDAWFDIVTAKAGSEQRGAILFALIIELPLALLTFYLAIFATHRFERKYKIV